MFAIVKPDLQACAARMISVAAAARRSPLLRERELFIGTQFSILYASKLPEARRCCWLRRTPLRRSAAAAARSSAAPLLIRCSADAPYESAAEFGILPNVLLAT